MTPLDPALERWRLILGAPGQACLGDKALSGTAVGRDAALDWLYGRDEDLKRRDICGAGSGESILTTVDWLDDIVSLFPKETVERMERDAVETYGLEDVVTDPAVLERIAPNPTLLKAVLRTKHLMSPEVVHLARRLVESVVRQLMEKLATEVRQSFTGARSGQRSRFRQASNFHVRRTIQSNLANYQPAERKLYIETPYFVSRNHRQVRPWQVILIVDQSGSMLGSVIHSAVTAACLWGLPGVKTHLIAFDTSVIDLTSSIDDPVKVLMEVQLGGGTDIAGAVEYGAGLIENPRRTIVALITDFYEGGSEEHLIRAVGRLIRQGTEVLGLAALDEEANPSYDRELAQRLANVGAHMGAMTPGELAAFIADKVGR